MQSCWCMCEYATLELYLSAVCVVSFLQFIHNNNILNPAYTSISLPQYAVPSNKASCSLGRLLSGRSMASLWMTHLFARLQQDMIVWLLEDALNQVRDSRFFTVLYVNCISFCASTTLVALLTDPKRVYVPHPHAT